MFAAEKPEFALRNDLAYAGGELLLKNHFWEGHTLILASQVLYPQALEEVLLWLERGNVEEASWIAFAYSHHPTWEKRALRTAPEGGWKALWELAGKEGLDAREDPYLLEAIYTAHLGEVIAILETYARRGFERVQALLKALSDTRLFARKYGLDRPAGPLPKPKEGVLSQGRLTP